ncbi:MarR family winged helix-turn-helix transcriptional regulator [Butyricicoccus sp.]|uniref:MarR family winged helix-turn-helix transcriptional regulator n=1 Tax=Butyricicoccus sp. TaxID=2049021 RepID=UPI003F14E87D
MTVHEQVNTFLVDIFGQINKLEQRALATGLNDDVSITEMHIMEKIGEAGSSRMTDIARALDVTLATLTVACDRMQKKDLIERTRAEKDRRVVMVSLTPKGQAAWQYHEKFHHDLIDAALADMSEEEQNALSRALEKLGEFLSAYER